MKKNLTAILMALTILISLLPIPAAAANTQQETQIKAAVSKVVTDYAKSVYRPNADDEAFNKYFKHGFYGNGKDMPLTEKGPMVSALFNSCLMQDFLTNSISIGITQMQELQIDEMYLHSSISWHNYYYDYFSYSYRGDSRDHSQFVGTVCTTKGLYGPDQYNGPRNEHDSVMELLVGGAYFPIIIKKTAVTADTVTYEAFLDIHDDFDFHGSYNDVANKGYDTSTDDNLKDLGLLMTFMGLDEFFWYFTTTLRFEVPNLCDHEISNYHWTYDGSTISLNSEAGSSYTENEATKRTAKVTSSSTGEPSTKTYFKLSEPVILRHDCPWVMEYDQTTLRALQLTFGDGINGAPGLYSYANHNVWFSSVREKLLPEGETTSTGANYISQTVYVGVETGSKFQYNSRHRYTHTLENKIDPDGSNMVYLTIYDHDLGETVFGPEPMDNYQYYDAKTESRVTESTESDYLNGRDLVINYVGNKSVDFCNPGSVLDIRIWENGKDAQPHKGTYTAPTCTEQGGMKHHCPDCEADYFTDAEPALCHSYGEYAPDGNETCTTDGTETRICTRCGEQDTVTVENSALGHDFTEYVSDSNVTCTADGTETRACTRCKVTETRTIEGSALGHDFGTYAFDHNATCTADGTKTAVCKTCGEKDVINADGSATGHNHKPTVTEPTCTQQGYTTYTCHCGDSYVDDYTEAAGHAEVEIPAVPSTCVEKGLTAGKQCSVCGEITVPQEKTQLGNHTWDAGEVIKAPTANAPGTLMYTCIHCGKTTHMSITEMPSTGFDDVPADAYYAAAVAWAKENGITSGLSETIFGSDMSCTRGQVVTFLWAAAGKPEPTQTENPFTDVSESDYYYKPVLWAVEQGITGGIGEGLFGPNNTCTRGQIVTFLWRAMNSPETGTENPFTDVTEADYYFKSVLWASENAITGGIGEGLFGPNNTCTRAQVVTFLWKVYR